MTLATVGLFVVVAALVVGVVAGVYEYIEEGRYYNDNLSKK
jgi:hypothetical protein